MSREDRDDAWEEWEQSQWRNTPRPHPDDIEVSPGLTWGEWRARHLAALTALCRMNPESLSNCPPNLAAEIRTELKGT